MFSPKTAKKGRQHPGGAVKTDTDTMSDAIAMEVPAESQTQAKERESEPKERRKKHEKRTSEQTPLQKDFLELMKKANWSIADIATQLRISESHARHLINGSKTPSEPLVELAKLKIAQETERKRLLPKDMLDSIDIRKAALVDQLHRLILGVLALDEGRQLKAVKHIQGLLESIR